MKKISVLLFVGFFLTSCATIERLDREIKAAEKTPDEGLYKTYTGIFTVIAVEVEPQGIPKGVLVKWDQQPKIEFENLLLPSDFWFIYSLDENVKTILSRIEGHWKVEINAFFEQDAYVKTESGQLIRVPVMRARVVNPLEKIEE